MLQDRRQQRLSEIDAINGVIVREGKRLGIATPANEEIVWQIKEMEGKYEQNVARITVGREAHEQHQGHDEN
jgi:2-dehydropantoate 2-reductase